MFRCIDGLTPHQKKGFKDSDNTDPHPKQNQGTGRREIDKEPCGSRDRARHTKRGHDGRQSPAVNRGPLHQGANDLQIFRSPIRLHGYTLYCKAIVVNAPFMVFFR